VNWPWRSPQGTRKGLSDKVKARHAPALRQQRMREIAYRRLLARLFALEPEKWVVKGGAALLLRLDPNRASNDIDLAYVAQAGEHAVALEALVKAAEHDLGDFFEFEIVRGETEEVDPEHPLERAVTVPVVARIGEAIFVEFSVDLALSPREDDVPIEWVTPEATLTGEAAVDETPPVALVALPAQIADKVCAIHERHGSTQKFSTRARDLADVAMIAQQKNSDGAELIAHVRHEERRRFEAGTLIEPLPAAFALAREQIADWRPRWEKATRNAPIAFDQALAVTAAFLDPVLDGTADGKRWSSAGRVWV
jgi:hypothetical protein